MWGDTVIVPHLPSDEPEDREAPDIDGIVRDILDDGDAPVPRST